MSTTQSALTGVSQGMQTAPRNWVVRSTVLVAPFDGKMRILAHAAGGSGAKAPAGGNATGGGSGEKAYDIVLVKAGDTFTIAVGAGGLGVSVVGTVGNPGGDLTITGPNGYALVLKGGGPGQQAASGPVAGGASGTGGTGGSPVVARTPGSRGGLISGAIATNKKTGGAGVNLNNLMPTTGTRGGDIGSNTFTAQCTGGGGTGGHGGDLMTDFATYPSGGGGSGSDAQSESGVGGVNYLGEALAAAPISMILAAAAALPFDVFGGGATNTSGAGGVVGNPGGGGGGGLNNGGAGGTMGGGGAGNLTGGAAGLGAGGGAAGSGVGSSGKGGDAFADITFERPL